MIFEKDRVIRLPSWDVIAKTSFQCRLAMTLRNLPEPMSRRELRVEAQHKIVSFKGKIIFPCGYMYDRRNVDNVLGHESGRQISMFLEMKDGAPRYKPSNLTHPRLMALYCYVAIRWSHLAEHIVK